MRFLAVRTTWYLREYLVMSEYSISAGTIRIIPETKMKYIKYLNTKTILHNFKEVVSLTNQLGIKNAIIYNANDYLFTVGKNFVANKIDKLQDEFIIGMNFCKFEDVNNVCRYLEKINPKLYKKYLNQSNGDNIRFCKRRPNLL